MRSSSRRAGRAAAALGLLCVLAGAAPAQECVSYADHPFHHALPIPNPETSPVRTLALGDGFAFAATEDQATYAYRMIDPRRPDFLGRIGGYTGNYEASLAGHGLLCLAGGTGLTLYDVSDPTDERLLIRLTGETGIRDLAWLDDRLVALYGDGVLRVADLTTPATPVWTHGGRVAATAFALAVVGGTAYVSGTDFIDGAEPAWSGVAAVTIGTEPDLVVSGRVTDAMRAWDLAADGNRLWAVGTDLRGFDLADPLAPPPLSATAVAGVRIAVRDDALLVAAGEDGLRRFDAADPTAPVEVDAPALPGRVTHVVSDGERILVGTSDRGAFTLGGRFAASPTPRDEPGTLQAYDIMAPWGDYVLGVSEAGRFDVLEWVWDQYLVPVSASWLYCDDVVGLFPFEEHCLVLTREQQLYALDLRVPEAPSWIQTDVGCCEPINDAVIDDALMVLCKDSGTSLWDVSDPVDPVTIGVVPDLDYDTSAVAAARGDRAVVSMKQGFTPVLVLLDITDPATPVVLQQYVLGLHDTPPSDLQISGDLLHAVFQTELVTYGGVRSGFLSPVTRVALDDASARMQLEGNRGILVGGDGVGILGLDEPEHPVILSVVPCGWSKQVLDTAIGRLVLRYDGTVARLYPDCDLIVSNDPGTPPPATPFPLCSRIVSAAPNPFNPAVRIAFALAVPGQVRLDVFDARGRRVRTLAERPFAAGDHAETWRGRDAAGRACPSGTYFVRLEQGDRVDTRKVLLAR